MATETDYRRPLFTAADQRVIAIVTLLALAAMVCSWLFAASSGGLVDVDQAEPLHATFQVDINAADWPELVQLPEVGETLARRIVESRMRDGHFATHDDLLRVPGIGRKTLDKIRPYLQPLN
jgi:competence protein ComEA